MNPNQLVAYYFDKKKKKELTKTEIKEELVSKHGFSPKEIKALFIEISNRELIEVQNQKTPIEEFLSSIFVSYFFLLFGIVIIFVSIFVLQTEMNIGLNKVLPWILICGALFMIYKHGVIIQKSRNREKFD